MRGNRWNLSKRHLRLSVPNISFCVLKKKVNQLYGFVTTWKWINDHFHFGVNVPFNVNCRRWRSPFSTAHKSHLYRFIHEETIELKNKRFPYACLIMSTYSNISVCKRNAPYLQLTRPLNCIGYQWSFSKLLLFKLFHVTPRNEYLTDIPLWN